MYLILLLNIEVGKNCNEQQWLEKNQWNFKIMLYQNNLIQLLGLCFQGFNNLLFTELWRCVVGIFGPVLKVEEEINTVDMVWYFFNGVTFS